MAHVTTNQDPRFSPIDKLLWDDLVAHGATVQRGIAGNSYLSMNICSENLGTPYFSEGGTLHWAYPVRDDERGVIVCFNGDNLVPRYKVVGFFTRQSFRDWFNENATD